MAIFTVTSTSDSGIGSLRQAILDANANPGADLITFAPSLNNQAITLTSDTLQITDDLTIDGDLDDDGTPDITVIRNFLSAPDFRIFTIDDGDGGFKETVVLDGLTIFGGSVVGAGGGIANLENLEIRNSTVTNNVASSGVGSGLRGGGGIFSFAGNLKIINSTISGNSTLGDGSEGGGILGLLRSSVTVINSTISGNSTTGINSKGGGIAIGRSSSLTVVNSTISGNSTTGNNSEGGGIFTGNNLALINSIVAGNMAINADGDEIAKIGTFSVGSDANNLLGNNSKSNDDAFLDFIPGASDITATSDGTNPTALSDILEPLADNGGGRFTHALPEGSPAINAGNNANIPQDLADQDGDGDTTESTPFDQRGNGFNRVSGGVVDIGAFEAQLTPGLDLEKFVNGEDADTEAIPVPVDAPINYTYRLTNTGDIPFDVVSLLDDNGTPAIFADDLRWRASGGGITIADGISLTSGDNDNLILEPGEVWEFAAVPQVAREGLVTNTADAGGTQTVGLIGVGDRDTASYNGFVPLSPSIDLEKFVNGVDADTPQEAVTVNVSAPITYTYTLENTGNVPFDDLQLTDDNGTPLDPFDDLSWSIGDIFLLESDFTFNGGDDNNNGILDPNEVWQLAYGVSPLDVQLGLVTSNASIEANNISITGNPSASDVDAANYVGTTTDATIFVNAVNVVVGNAFQSGQLYDGNLASNTDSTFGTGLSPDDVIEGTEDNDNIWAGETGNDLIDSGAGNDTVGMGTGDVTVFAGEGDDFVYSVSGGGGTNVIDLGEGNNEAWLESGNNDITAGSGDDVIGLGDGIDRVDAGDGNNTVYMVDPNGTTDGAKDILTGMGNDWVQTGSGNDRLDLGTNAGGESDFDIAFGQGGSDTFVLNEGTGWLTVGDFTQGEDLLEISGITFADIGSSVDAGRNSTWVWDNVSGDVLAELQGFTGTLTAGDFAAV